MASPVFPLTSTLEQRLSGTPLVLLLDIDGTLSPIAPRPQEAVVPEDTRRVLRELIAIQSIHIAAISGRGAADARRVVGVPGIWVIGNHGIEVAPPDGEPEVRSSVLEHETSIAKAARELTARVGHEPGVIVENKRWTLTIHYRLTPSELVPSLEQTVVDVATELGLLVTRGTKVLEIRPPVAIDKGIAAVEFAASFGALTNDGSVLCAGDDRTDEDAFHALRAAYPRSVTIRVKRSRGEHVEQDETAAEFDVEDTSEILQLLKWLARRRAHRNVVEEGLSVL